MEFLILNNLCNVKIAEYEKCFFSFTYSASNLFKILFFFKVFFIKVNAFLHATESIKITFSVNLCIKVFLSHYCFWYICHWIVSKTHPSMFEFSILTKNCLIDVLLHWRKQKPTSQNILVGIIVFSYDLIICVFSQGMKKFWCIVKYFISGNRHYSLILYLEFYFKPRNKGDNSQSLHINKKKRQVLMFELFFHARTPRVVKPIFASLSFNNRRENPYGLPNFQINFFSPLRNMEQCVLFCYSCNFRKSVRNSNASTKSSTST